jgi:GNAT superfamily N-acetyltransferase
LSPALTEVVRTYLELRDPSQFRPSRVADPRLAYVRRDPCSVPHYRALYDLVGAPWHWRDRRAWGDDRLSAHLARPEVVVWELLVGGESAGYFELERGGEAPTDVQIAYFGLAPGFIGRGLGGAMLTRAVEEAWAMGATRVWLHTCSLDSPRAMPNYLARGFEPYDEEKYFVQLPEAV